MLSYWATASTRAAQEELTGSDPGSITPANGYRVSSLPGKLKSQRASIFNPWIYCKRFSLAYTITLFYFQ